MKLQAASFALAMALAGAPALAADPPVPLGQDPGGTAVAIISTGIDYTIPEIAQSLARDGEGEIIAWDFVDGDNRPYASSAVLTEVRKRPGTDYANQVSDQTTLAYRLVKSSLRLIMVRITPDEPLSMAKAAAFIARTPARIVVVSANDVNAEQWEPLRQAAEHLKDYHFILWGGPINWGLPNVEGTDNCKTKSPEPLEGYAQICSLLAEAPPDASKPVVP